MPHDKVCVVYHYHEVDDTYTENLLHFLLFGYQSSLDYFIVISGKHSLELPTAANITYVHADNANYDFGGYSFALNGAIPLESYDYFVFVNSSVRGPYLPTYVDKPWHEVLLDLLKDDVRLVGATINILSPTFVYTNEFKQRHGGSPPYSHVQSMVFAAGREVVLQLKEKLFVANREQLKKTHVITDYEILMSQLVIRDGGNIRCLLPEYNTLDYRKPHADVNPTSVNGDPCFEGAYFGRTMHPCDAMFIKTNRNLYPSHFLDKITYSMIQGRPSQTELNNLLMSSYIEKRTKKVRFNLPMPSIADQVAHVKLTSIMQSINSILATRS